MVTSRVSYGILGPQLTRAQPHPLTPTWYGCDLVSGQIIAELPTLTPQGAFGRRLGETVNATFTLGLSGRIDPDWLAATQPGRSLLVCVVQGIPIWCGIIIGPRQRGSLTTCQFTTINVEGYLDRRYVGDHTWTSVDEASVVAAGLLADAQGTNSIFTIDAPADGNLISQTYDDSDDKTVWSALTDLWQTGSPETVVDVVWRDSTQTSVQLVARVRPRVGVSDVPPSVVFDQPGRITDYSQIESYEAGHGATRVMAEGNGESSTRVTSGNVDATALLAAGWPIWEYRWTPSQATADATVLAQQAGVAVDLMGTGSSIWTVTAAASRAPVPGIDFNLGDVVGLEVAAADPTHGYAGSPGHPAGVSTSARVWGWDLDLSVRGNTVSDVLTPILAEDSEGGY